MSAFRSMNTVMNDELCLVTALKKRFKQVEQHKIAKPLFGYQGDYRTLDGSGHTKDENLALKAEVIIRRNFVGGSSNDIGFARNSKGNFDAIISAYDSYTHNQNWVNKLAEDYMVEKAQNIMTENEADFVDKVTLPNGSIQLRYRVNA